MWYCSWENKNYGPFSTEEARQFIDEHPNALVWKDGMPEWMPSFTLEPFSKEKVVSLPQKSLKTQLDFRICGDDMQYVELALRPRETIIAEPGSMIFKQIGIEFEALMGSNPEKGFLGRLMSAGKRVLTGERFFISAFTNYRPDKKQRVAFAAPYPGKIIPISLSDFGREIVCQKDSFLCAESDVNIGVYFQKRIMTGLFGGAGFIMQRLSGRGIVFINGGGTIHEHTLKIGESIQVDAGCLVGFQPTVTFNITEAGNLKSQFFGGSGLFFADLMGPGKIWVQSLPFSRLARRLVSTPAAKKASQKKN